MNRRRNKTLRCKDWLSEGRAEIRNTHTIWDRRKGAAREEKRKTYEGGIIKRRTQEVKSWMENAEEKYHQTLVNPSKCYEQGTVKRNNDDTGSEECAN